MIDIGRAVAADQHVNITAQLDLGVRMLQAQAHLYVFFIGMHSLKLNIWQKRWRDSLLPHQCVLRQHLF